jgi:predicted DCC family thiol-disulfide oxidoreductase YuxK
MRPTVFYDDDCGFCKAIAATLAQWDRGDRLRFAPIQGPLGDKHLGDLSPAERLASLHFVDAHGTRSSGGAALAPLFARLPAGTVLAEGLRRAPGAADRGYRLIADNRSSLSRLVPERFKRWASAELERPSARRGVLGAVWYSAWSRSEPARARVRGRPLRGTGSGGRPGRQSHPVWINLRKGS